MNVPRRLTPPAAALAVIAAVALSAGSGQAATTHKSVAVFPFDGTDTASAKTQISFRRATLAELQASHIRVTGSQSGSHSGQLRAHSDGHGASFLPDNQFTPGEDVTVESDLPLVNEHNGHISFHIATPPGNFDLPTQHDQGGHPPGSHDFHTLPDLHPPTVHIRERHPDSYGEGDVFVAAKAGPGADGPMIVDELGRLIWYWKPPEHRTVFDFRKQTYRGNPVLTWWQGISRPGQGLGHGVILNSNYKQIAHVEAANGYKADLHEFEISRRNTALLLVYNPVSFGGGKCTCMDTIVQEIDIPTGLVLYEWHTLGNISSKYTYAEHRSNQPFDIAHLNSIQMEPSGNLLVSARHTHAVYELNHITGRINWTLGGKHSDFSLSPSSHFVSQHDARLQPDGSITMYDNQNPPTPGTSGGVSRALWLNVHYDTKKVNVRRSYRYPYETIQAQSQGSMQVLPTASHVFVGWGGSYPYMTEFTESGDVIWNANFKPASDDTYRAYRFPWTAQPNRPPDVAGERGGGQTTVWMSWNGATEVASWRIHYGPTAATLTGTKDQPRGSFETKAVLDGEQQFVQVEALDKDGNVLGTSNTVATTSSG